MEIIPSITEAYLDGLRDLIGQCGNNRNDQAISVIQACISDGYTNGKIIVQIGKSVGLHGRHMGKMLSDNTGADPAQFLWQRDDSDGSYRLHA